MSDEQLVARVASGDENALRELLRLYQRPLSAFLYRHTGGREVEDLYQETWLRVVKHAGKFDGSKRFSTWLFQIAVNLCRDWHRRRSLLEPSGRPSEPGSADVNHVETTLDAEALLARLPENQREVVILRFFHDMSEQEMSVVLDCPRGTVKSRLHNALTRMAQTGGDSEATS